MWSLNKIKQLRRNSNIFEGNMIKKRFYYIGQLPINFDKNYQNLWLEEDQLSHPLILGINVERREFYITSFTHLKYFEGNEHVFIDKKGNKSYIWKFKTVNINRDNLKILTRLLKEVKDIEIVKS